ncbi:hypothetical protein BLA29_013549 [Euroglyphus maynei]|uniref:Uncharacterized protein n=1 Tax=Euroglyphus maynei TaxID=6958 RepID=A0A1Y3BRI7_EURMA|nr:hypothetical protein BLA29_013549 [Euroglyphus maynei]
MDQFLLPPGIVYGKIPWALLCSASPRFLFDTSDLPPMGSGYPSNDRNGWKEFQAKMDKSLEGFIDNQNQLNKELGYPQN